MNFFELYAWEYLAKIFYFCLKKTGDRYEAEELAVDISLTVLESLSKGRAPENFGAWVRTIAKRRFARWCERRRVWRENTVFQSDEDKQEPADDSHIDEKLIESEMYSSMRRELAFIAKEHRELLVSHYIECVGVAELSTRLDIPVGTVKTRLMRARKILKEGMDMAREFGKRSYRPEDIAFTASGMQPDGLPWKAVGRKIPENILLEANNNPSTLEELSMGLGIAAPYMEDEISLLVDATLLEKVGDKYVTNFFIADNETQYEIWKAEKAVSGKCAELLDEAMRLAQEKIESVPQTCGMDSTMWFLNIMMINDAVGGIYPPTVFNRPNGGTWGFTGFEINDLVPENNIVCSNSCMSDTMIFGRFAVYRLGFTDGGYFGTTAGELFADIIVNRRKADSITAGESAAYSDLFSHGYLHERDGEIIPDIVVLREDSLDALRADILGSEPGKELIACIAGLSDEIMEILRRNSNPVLHKTLGYYASMFLFNLRAMVIADEVSAGGLAVPSDRKVGTYLIIK